MVAGLDSALNEWLDAIPEHCAFSQMSVSDTWLIGRLISASALGS